MDKRRGRPLGYKLSDLSRQAISDSKRGQRHSQETRDKISKTLLLYFRKLNPISEEITNRYCRTNDDKTCDWMQSVREQLDNSEDVMTDRQMTNVRKTEISYGQNIEYFFHELTPETILILKETCIEQGLDFKQLFKTYGMDI
jgi:hypothetical protein